MTVVRIVGNWSPRIPDAVVDRMHEALAAAFFAMDESESDNMSVSTSYELRHFEIEFVIDDEGTDDSDAA